MLRTWNRHRFILRAAALIVGLFVLILLRTASGQAPSAYRGPRGPDGKPNLNGVWQAFTTASFDLEDHNAQKGVPAGQGIVEGGAIPYRPEALQKRTENHEKRLMLDPLHKCYLPGVPRIMYMPFPFEIFKERFNHVARQAIFLCDSLDCGFACPFFIVDV